MAAILLDVDGVLHVSGEPILGAVEAVGRLRENGHRLRFVTNTTTRSRAQLVAELVGLGFDVDDSEVQTVAAAAVEALKGKRVLALTMHAIVGDLEGIELVGDNVEAVLLGGAELGAELYCLHRNRWWQTKHGPQFDAGAYVAGLEYAAGVEAVVLGKPSPSYFAAACKALDADPQMAWMIGDDLESDILGAQGIGMKAVLVRTGKFRPDAVEVARTQPDGIISSIGNLPEWIEEHL